MKDMHPAGGPVPVKADLVAFTPADKGRMLPWIRAFWQAHHMDVTLAQAEETLQSWLDGKGRLYVIHVQGRPAGFMRLHLSSPAVCWLDDLFCVGGPAWAGNLHGGSCLHGGDAGGTGRAELLHGSRTR